MYGALENTKCMTQTFEIAKRYGEGAVYIILTFDDLFNTQGIRAVTETISNKEFLAVFGGNDNIKEYKSLKEFLNIIQENSHYC